MAAELGDGVFSAAVPQPDAVNAADWRALLSFGSVLDEGEELTSPRVVDAVAPGAVVMYHAMYERGGAAVVDAVTRWAADGVRRSRPIPRTNGISPSTKGTW